MPQSHDPDAHGQAQNHSSTNRDQQRSPGPEGDNEPRVFISEPQPIHNAQPGVSASTPTRTVPIAALTALAVVVALLLGGLGGYFLGRGSEDVSASGQISYACALVENVRAGHTSEDDWGKLGEDNSYNEVAAISALLGGFVPLMDPEGNVFPPLGRQVSEALARVQFGELNEVLEETHQECQNR